MRGYEKGSELYNKWHDEKARDKKRLPLFVYMAGHIEPSARGNAMCCWRKQESIRLNGLVMADFDDLDDPRKVYAEHAVAIAELGDRILLTHITPSGHGLRFVCKGDPAVGNIADNQEWFAKAIGLTLDGVCKDSSRASFAVSKSNIIHFNKEIFTYENKEFDEKYGDDYRRNCSSARNHDNHSGSNPPADGHQLADGKGDGANGRPSVQNCKIVIPTNEKGEYVYKGIPYRRIVDGLLASYGGAPSVGERNTFYYDMARRDMRYICDFNEDFMLSVMPDFGLSESERRQALRSALAARRFSLSKRCQSVLRGLGLSGGDAPTAKPAARGAGFDHEQIFRQFKPFFGGPWAPALNALDDRVKLAGFLAVGAMLGTYLSPVRLKNFYDGDDYRLSFMVYIIGQAASGKGVFVDLNRMVMEPLRLQDEQGRKWEEKYKEDKEMRANSSKNQKQEAMQIEHFPIRVLPGTISNAMRYKRMKNAVTVIDGNEVHLHCYIFESELSAKLRSEQGTWAGAQDLDCKSFSNEYGGNDYGNAQAVNGLIEVNMNQVITGTQDAMNRKITARNCLDGLATRLIVFEMPDNSFTMLEKRRVRRTIDEQMFLRTIGTKLQKCTGSVDLAQKVIVPPSYRSIYGQKTSISDALYKWGTDEADRCRETEDRCADYFRRRAPIIAARYAVVDAILRDVDHFSKTGKLKLTFNNVLLAVKLASYIQESQMYFFGKKIMDALEDTENNFTPESKKVGSRSLLFSQLPKEFTINDVAAKMPDKTRRTAENTVSEWKRNQYIKMVRRDGKNKVYVKLVNNI